MLLSRLKHLSRVTLFIVITIALLCVPAGEVSALNTHSQLDSQAASYAIVFVSRKIPADGSVYLKPNQTGSLPGVGPYSRLQVSAPGKLMVREASGTLRTLVDGSKPTAASLNLIDVNSPDVSYDGTKIVFAGLVNGSYDTSPLTNPGGWRIYTINVDGTGLQQVTFSDRDNLDLSQFRDNAGLFKKYDDYDPAWLPDGRIVLSSTRWPSFGQYGGSRTSNLYVVNADGSNLHRITSERNGADRPQVDPLTGKIVYARWWRNFRIATNSMATIPDPKGGYIQKDGLLNIIHSQPPPNDNEVGGFKNLERNTWQLATINPDGTHLAQWGGRSSSYFLGQISNHAYGGSFAPDGSFYANFFPMNNMTEAAGFGGIRHYPRGPNNYIPIIGVTMRDDSKMPLVSKKPPSYGIYKSNYAAEPEVLPDGRLLISLATSIAQDYGLYIINPDGTGLTKLYDNPGTTELRARVIQARPLPPIIQDNITQVASLLPPLAGGPYDTDGNFTFQDLNVYFNAPVDTNILSAMPVGSANTIRFFIDHQRWQQNGSNESLDWPILLKEIPVNSDGSITTNSPADVPLFEQIRTAKPDYTVPLTGRGAIQELGGAAHVAGMNFGRPGDVVRCVGCHAGHSMIPVPANAEDAQWTNLAPGAAIQVSSIDPSLPNSNGLVDRRVHMPLSGNRLQKYWISKSGLAPSAQWVQLTFPVPVTVRTVRLYNIPAADSAIKVLNTTVRLYADSAATQQVASSTSGALSENGTDVGFNDVPATVVRIQLNSVNGNAAALGEVEVIASAGAIPPSNTTPVNISIHKSQVDAYHMVDGEQVTTQYAVLDGPVQVTSADGSSVLTSQRVTSGNSYNELMGMPSNKFSTEYWFPYYDHGYPSVAGSNMRTWILVANPSISSTAHVQIYIAGMLQSNPDSPTSTTFTIGPGKNITPRWVGAQGGPVRVVSDIPIFASERVFTSNSNAFNESLGIATNDFASEYWFPWYDSTNMNTSILVGNTSSSDTANVDIYIGANKQGSYDIPPNTTLFESYPSLADGPVRVVSTNGVNVVSSENAVSGPSNSFSDVMGYPFNQFTTEYWFPYYDHGYPNVAGSNMRTWILVGNPSDSEAATVNIYIGGNLMSGSPFSIAPGKNVTPRWIGMQGGPVHVVSDIPVFASERVFTAPDSIFNEMFGYPFNQLTAEYWFPWYDNVNMKSWLLIAKP